MELKERRGDIAFNVTQTRTKIKRCVKICRDTLMKVKTASGIERFQDDKNLGTWFKDLLPVIMEAPNAQPDQAVEPAVAGSSRDDTDSGFIPRKRPQSGRMSVESSMAKIQKTIDSLTERLDADSKHSEELLKLIKEDSEKQEQRNNAFLAMMNRFLDNSQRSSGIGNSSYS